MVEATAASHGFDVLQVVSLLAAAVVAVPLFKRLGLGSVMGYLAAGLVVGPYGLGLFHDPQAIIHVAELGVVIFLFVIGLEMQPSRLWAMRGEIFGLGVSQVLVCMVLLTCVGLALGYPLSSSFVAGAGFVLTSTAIVMQMLDERRQLAMPPGRRMVAILLLEDLAIVPLLALVAFMAPGGESVTGTERAISIVIALGAVGALVVAGHWLLDPLFSLLARAKAREVMTAAALLVVLGSAVLMQWAGLSMAMGAFLAGVLLSESTFRHQLEADVEPFRGMLLGLFFLGVGMALDLQVIAANVGLIAVAVTGYMLLKMAGIYAVARIFRAGSREAIDRAVLMAQGGEFAFVLYAAATSAGILSGEENAVLTAMIIVSMALTPLLIILHDRLLPPVTPSMEGIEPVDGSQSASVLLIGFGRFGQIASQPLLAQTCTITIIDTDPEMIRSAREFGFKVHYGDGSRLDILHAAGAGQARLVLVAVDDKEATTKIVELMKTEFPKVPVLARAWDREHVLDLVHADVDWQIRETFESALVMGAEALRRMDNDEETVAAVIDDLRKRDRERVALEVSGGLFAGRDLLIGNLKRQ